jgi:hypothetical protein
MLILNSAYDEAWQLLRQVSSMANPLEVPEGLFRFIFKEGDKYVKDRLVTDFGNLALSRLNTEQSVFQTAVSQSAKCVWIAVYVWCLLIIGSLVVISVYGWENDHIVMIVSFYQRVLNFVVFLGPVFLRPLFWP